MESTHLDLIRSLTGGNDKLVLEFFVVFSRFECALKRAKFVKGDKYGNALPDWKLFADKLNGRFTSITNRDFTVAQSHLLQKPPQKQEVRYVRQKYALGKELQVER